MSFGPLVFETKSFTSQLIRLFFEERRWYQVAADYCYLGHAQNKNSELKIVLDSTFCLMVSALVRSQSFASINFFEERTIMCNKLIF